MKRAWIRKLWSAVAFGALASTAAAQTSAPIPPPVQPQRLPGVGVPAAAPSYVPQGPIQNAAPVDPGASYSANGGPVVDSGAPPIYDNTGGGGQMGRTWRQPMRPSGGGCGDGVCGPYGRVWFEADYLHWRQRGDRLPALVTNSPAGTTQANAGVLGQAATGVLFGNSLVNDEMRHGIRIGLGGWLDSAQTVGLQATWFMLQDGDEGFTRGSNAAGEPILARPFQNVNNNNAEQSQLIAFPNVIAGNVAATTTSTTQAFDIALRGNMCCNSCWRLDALLGYKRFELIENVSIRENLTALAGAPNALGVPLGTNIIVQDRFAAENVFHGVQVGIAGERRFGQALFVNGAIKANLGYLDGTTLITGRTDITVPGQTTVSSIGGLLALDKANIGRRHRSEGAVIPEINLNVGYQVTDNVRIRVGYDFIYLHSVYRPGATMETTINPNLIPPQQGAATPARPAFRDERNDFYLQGLNAGFEIRF